MSGPREGLTTEALVLSAADSRDDRIVRLLTPAHGLVPAVARRARASRRGVASHLDPLTRVEATVLLRPGRDLATLRAVHAEEGFPRVKGDLLRLALATTMCDVVLHLVPDHGHEPGAYELLLRALRHLEHAGAAASEDLLLLFELRMLTLAGLLPDVAAIPGLPDEAREGLAGWLEGRWRPLEPAARRRAAAVLEATLEEATGRPLRSRTFLDQVLEQPPEGEGG